MCCIHSRVFICIHIYIYIYIYGDNFNYCERACIASALTVVESKLLNAFDIETLNNPR